MLDMFTSHPFFLMSRPPRVETGNVLSDIDNMLQDLTDELDAMLKEETSA